MDTLAQIERDLDRLTWMVGFNLAMTLAVLWRVFAHGGGVTMEPVTNPWIKWSLAMTAVWLVAVLGLAYFVGHVK
jgi:hypothetical protein